MNVIDQTFADLRARGERALMPFIAAGDPDLATTSELLSAFANAGCPLCELGIPYSDPIADGPVIQSAFTRALQGSIKVDSILSSVKQTSHRPVCVAMLSFAIVHQYGLARWVDQAAAAGFGGLIVPDLPGDESQELGTLCRGAGLSLIPLITPTTTPARAAKIVAAASGFIYYVSVAGVTGARRDLPPEITSNLAQLRNLTDLPICVGFGVSSAEQVRQLTPHCDGVIVGSAIVRLIEEEWTAAGCPPSGTLSSQTRQAIVERVETFCRELVQATRG